MTLSEFTKLTGVEPTFLEYQDIEDEYYAFNGDKEAFCKAWGEAGGPAKLYAARTAYIEQLKDRLVEQRKEYEAELKRLKDKMSVLELRIADLEASLDKELDWQEAKDTGTNMEQSQYEELSSAGRVLTDALAKSKIAEYFGFAPELVEIITVVHTYEVDKYHRLRRKETFERAPVYNATDWNYIRFNVRGWQYEMVNGMLRPYCS